MTRRLLPAAALALSTLLACGAATSPPASTTPAVAEQAGTLAAGPIAEGLQEAIFAGGCFWCTESDFEKVGGVVSAVSGYIDGPEQHPTYKQVSSHQTGHTEAVRVVFNPEMVSYEALLDHFWRNHDPLDARGQFCDKGSQYRPGIYTVDEDQKRSAESSRAKAQSHFKQPIVTEIKPASTFWVAEDYHQDFYKKNPTRYYSYRTGCGRDRAIEALWEGK